MAGTGGKIWNAAVRPWLCSGTKALVLLRRRYSLSLYFHPVPFPLLSPATFSSRWPFCFAGYSSGCLELPFCIIIFELTTTGAAIRRSLLFLTASTLVILPSHTSLPSMPRALDVLPSPFRAARAACVPIVCLRVCIALAIGACSFDACVNDSAWHAGGSVCLSFHVLLHEEPHDFRQWGDAHLMAAILKRSATSAANSWHG